jgi:hypothetical protein
MEQLVAAMILGGMAIAQMSGEDAKSGHVSVPKSALISESGSVRLSALPPVPKGKSTILGGEIKDVDSVRDRFTLDIFGQRRVKILYDERTEVYLDGNRIPLRDLHSHDHASVQTVLDGTNVFALSIHMLSRSPEGEYRGRVINFDLGTNELTISAALSNEPLKLLVPATTLVVREGQATLPSTHFKSSDLIKGDLISVKFEPDRKGRGVASQITILPPRESAFELSGYLSSLDMHSGRLLLVDPQDEKSYEISFDSARLPATQDLHNGDFIRVTATFDGIRYVADAIAAKEPVNNLSYSQH